MVDCFNFFLLLLYNTGISFTSPFHSQAQPLPIIPFADPALVDAYRYLSRPRQRSSLHVLGFASTLPLHDFFGGKVKYNFKAPQEPFSSPQKVVRILEVKIRRLQHDVSTHEDYVSKTKEYYFPPACSFF